MNIHEEIRQYIIDKFVYAENGEASLQDHVSLLDEGILDSFGIISVISFLEETFGVTLEDHELVPDNLESINAITTFVEQKLATNVEASRS